MSYRDIFGLAGFAYGEEMDTINGNYSGAIAHVPLFIYYVCVSMSEEFNLSIEDGEAGESGGEQVSEEARQRARDDAAKAKQVRTQIQQIQHQNKQYALMLSLLLQLIDNDKVLGYVFTQLIDHKVPTPAIFAQFLPFLRHRIDITTYQSLYGELWNTLPQEETVVSLVTWLKQVRVASQTLQTIDSQTYLPFVLDYLAWMRVIDMASLDEEKRQEFEMSVKRELG